MPAVVGTVKTVKQWQRVWADRKYLAKKAASAARQSASATGGGPSTATPISEIDRRIISIMGEGFGSQQVEGRVPAFYPAGEPASAAAVGAPPHVVVASQDAIFSEDIIPLDPLADEERLGYAAQASTSSLANEERLRESRVVHAVPSQSSQPSVSSAQNQSQAQTSTRTLRASRGLSGNSLGTRMMTFEEQRLNIEQQRLATEERLVAVNESIVTELQQLRLEIIQMIREVIQLLSKK